jgi:hypothetical protein
MGVERDSKTGELTHVYGDQGKRGLSGDDEIAAGFYGKVEGPPEPIRDHGKVVTAPAGTPQQDVVDKLAGTDKVPSLDELSQAKAPAFDPHAGREVAPGREFGDEAEPMVTTLVFFGVDQGGDFEDAVHQLVAAAKDLGLHYITATVGKLDFNKMDATMVKMANQIDPIDPTDGDELDEELV